MEDVGVGEGEPCRFVSRPGVFSYGRFDDGARALCEVMEVEAGDFIWMGPYVPQSFYATGPVAAKYIYYKNVNRDVEL